MPRSTIFQRMTPATPATELRAATIAVTVNGDARELPAGTTILELLQRHELDPRLVVVEHNRVILRDRDAFGDRALADGDVLELVHFVGGG